MEPDNAGMPPKTRDVGEKETSNSNSSSLNLSLTPPLSDGPRQESNDSGSSSIISEHLSSSVENDRSMQEVEVDNIATNFSDLLLLNLPSDSYDYQNISQEQKPQSLNSNSYTNSHSNPSFNRSFKIMDETNNNVKSILEEILNNEQFHFDSESKETSLNIFANVNLDDKLLSSYRGDHISSVGSAEFNLINELKSGNYSMEDVSRTMKDFEELLAIKDSTIAALNSELDSFRELKSNTSSYSLGTTTTEYKQFQEECHNRLVEFQNAITHKDELIQKLTESLHQSVLHREELKQQAEHFKIEILELNDKLKETSEMLKNYTTNQTTKPIIAQSENGEDITTNLEINLEFDRLEKVLNAPQLPVFNEFKMVVKNYFNDNQKRLQEEVDKLKVELEVSEKQCTNEILKLKDLADDSGKHEEIKRRLEDKHSKEMEELRTYFEKKCADLEKNYSEEIFSHHSRKMSGSSSCSEAELTSDFTFNNPGPGGDVRSDYTKKDFLKLKTDLNKIIDLFSNFNLDNLTDDDFNHLKEEVKKFDLRNLFKYDLSAIRAELQNKYHAELEILREDFENRIDDLHLANENKVKEMECKYNEDIADLTEQLKATNSQMVLTSGAAQEVISSGEFEIDEVVQSYERRLQEQIALAKIDLINALEAQVQRLAASDSFEEDWPEELVRLKDRFAEKYQNEIAVMQLEHQTEISRLKEEHMRNLNGALERARRRSLKDADSLNKTELELVQERDNLKKQSIALRNLVGELLKYFTQCEDELNNTLVEELFRHGFVDNTLSEETETETDNPITILPTSPKRVHLAPNDLINLIDKSTTDDLDSIDLKGELGSCLEKLKADANAILAMSINVTKQSSIASDIKVLSPPQLSRSNSLENKVSSLTRQLINETQLKNELAEQLKDAKSLIQTLESERIGLETQLEQILDKQKVIEENLTKAHSKIAELIENGHKEIVSEGYGEEGRGVTGLVDAIAILHELQEKSRPVIEHPETIDPNMVNLIENFSRIAEKLVEEAKRDHEDLKQQIEAADKKYRATRQFLEEQAGEREQERDDAQKQIAALRDELKERDKDRASCERINHEVENLEQQVRDMAQTLQETEKRFEEVDSERKEAIEKIFILRDIIRDLEVQVESKTRAEEELRTIVSELECLVKQHNNCNDDDLIHNVKRVEQLHQTIGDLEGEVQRLRLSTEIAGSEGAIQQFRINLTDFETTLDKRTKDLEGLHSTISTTCCSSPSEEMSIRDVVNPASVETIAVSEECEVPLQQLARLREKLIRHSRAEDAAVKRIRDLEMQVYNLKGELEENQNEREILKKQIADQLVLISSLQIRLDDQRIRAEHIEKQTNTSLEVRIYDLQDTIALLEEKLVKKEKTISQLNNTIEEIKRRLKEREAELAMKKDDELVIKMQEQLENLRSENAKLKTRIDDTKLLPNLVENIISDKNNDIEGLKEKLSEVEKQLEMYSSLNLDASQIETLNKLKCSGMSFLDLLSLSNEQIRRMEDTSDNILSPITPLNNKRHKAGLNDTVFVGVESEISHIEKEGGPHHFLSLQAHYGKPNSTEKHVRFEDEIMEDKIKELERELEQRNDIIEEFKNKMKTLEVLEKKVENSQNNLKDTEELLKQTSDSFEKELNEMIQKEKNLQFDLATKIEEIEGKNREIDKYKDELENLNGKIAKQDDYSKEIAIKTATIEQLNLELDKVNLQLIENNKRNEDLENKIKQQNKIMDKQQNLNDEISRLNTAINDKKIEIDQLYSKLNEANKEINHLQSLLTEKDKIIDQMTEDSRSLHLNLETIQNKLQETGNVIDLGRRLKEEQKKNWELVEQIHELKIQLYSNDKIDDLSGKVQKELNYSAYLDSSIASTVIEPIQDMEYLQKEYQKEKLNNEKLIKTKNELEVKNEELSKICEDLNKNLKKLQLQLEKEKLNIHAIQLEDGKLIEQMRIRLDSALNNENELEQILETEKNERLELEKQLEALKQKISILNQFSSKSSDSITEYKELQDLELKKLQKEYKLLKENNNQLHVDNKALTQAKFEIESALKYAQDLASLKIEEIKGLERQVQLMTKSEKAIGEEMKKLKKLFEEKSKEIDVIQQDRTKMKRQMDLLNQKLKNQQQSGGSSSSGGVQKDDMVPMVKIMKRMQEINVAVQENKKMLDLITKLNEEKEVLKQRIIDLETQNYANLPFEDPVSRADYLFAKYLRADSYRKALVFQKRYLISLLATYQLNEALINTSTDDDLIGPRKRIKFRQAVIVIIAVNRMKYLVRRWHSGRRFIRQRSAAAAQQAVLPPITHFQIGQPVSSQNFLAATRFASADHAIINSNGDHNNRLQNSWTGQTPPAKEKQRTRIEPLTSPTIMSQIVERFNEIRDTLGMATEASSS